MALETLFTKSKFKINQSLYFTQRFLDCIFSEPVCTNVRLLRELVMSVKPGRLTSQVKRKIHRENV